MVILTMLLQSLLPLAFALTSTPQQNKSLVTVCTMQGYKQIWTNLETKNNPDSTTISCPYCLLNHIELDAIDTELGYYFNSVDSFTDGFLIAQTNHYPRTLSKGLSIRAPPQYL